jgi:hypothetical protein
MVGFLWSVGRIRLIKTISSLHFDIWYMDIAHPDKEAAMEYMPDKRFRAKSRKAFLAGSIPLQYERWVACPYCGEAFISVVDGSAGNQSYYEDCEICCRPILFHIEIDSDGNILGIGTQREDD